MIRKNRKRRRKERIENKHKEDGIIKKIRKIRPIPTVKSFNERFPNYNDYMISTEWKLMKGFLFSYTKKQCVCCLKKKNIDVHHRSYTRIGTLNEIKDLIPVCRTCHDEIHFIQDRDNIPVYKATKIHISLTSHLRKKKRYKQPKKVIVNKQVSRLDVLKHSSKINKKHQLIKELRLKGIRTDFSNLDFQVIQKLHTKYV